MHQVCDRMERHREKITHILNPYLQISSAYFAQPNRVPNCWYDIQNLETVVQQLFTPKLNVRMHSIDNVLCMSRTPVVDLARKEFMPLPLPKEDLNDQQYNDDNNPNTGIQILADTRTKTKQFNDNVLEQFT